MRGPSFNGDAQRDEHGRSAHLETAEHISSAYANKVARDRGHQLFGGGVTIDVRNGGGGGTQTSDTRIATSDGEIGESGDGRLRNADKLIPARRRHGLDVVVRPTGNTTSSPLLNVLREDSLEKADFVKFAKGTTGTRCSNCSFQDGGLCTYFNKDLGIDLRGLKVYPDTCCKAWEQGGMSRPRHLKDGEATLNHAGNDCKCGGKCEKCQEDLVENARKRDDRGRFTVGQKVRFEGKSADGQVEGGMDVVIVDPHSNAYEVAFSKGRRNYDKRGFTHIPTATVERPEQKRLSGEVRPAKRFEAYHFTLKPVTNAWTDAARQAARNALEASTHALKSSRTAGSPEKVGLGQRNFGRDHAKDIKFAAQHAVEANAAGQGKRSGLGQDHYHRMAAQAHERAANEHALYADSAHRQGKVALGMLHSQAESAHRRASEAHREASTLVGNAAYEWALPAPSTQGHVTNGGPNARFASEPQRRYLWSQEPEIAESWAHGEHSSAGNRHTMPKGPGPDVAGPQAEKARKALAKQARRRTG